MSARNDEEALVVLVTALHTLITALREAAAGFAVIAKVDGYSHPGCADPNAWPSVRAFALENFHRARAVLTHADERAL